MISNSRVRKMKLPVVISLRKVLPIWAMPNGSLRRVVLRTLSKLTKMPCAVSGRRWTRFSSVWTGPMWVSNMRLNWRASVKVPVSPQLGQASPSRLSARKRWRQLRQSTRGSVKFSTWPLARQTSGCMRMAASRPTMSRRPQTKVCHQWRLTLFLSSTPRGP